MLSRSRIPDFMIPRFNVSHLSSFRFSNIFSCSQNQYSSLYVTLEIGSLYNDILKGIQLFILLVTFIKTNCNLFESLMSSLKGHSFMDVDFTHGPNSFVLIFQHGVCRFADAVALKELFSFAFMNFLVETGTPTHSYFEFNVLIILIWPLLRISLLLRNLFSVFSLDNIERLCFDAKPIIFIPFFKINQLFLLFLRLLLAGNTYRVIVKLNQIVITCINFQVIMIVFPLLFHLTDQLHFERYVLLSQAIC